MDIGVSRSQAFNANNIPSEFQEFAQQAAAEQQFQDGGGFQDGSLAGSSFFHTPGQTYMSDAGGVSMTGGAISNASLGGIDGQSSTVYLTVDSAIGT